MTVVSTTPRICQDCTAPLQRYPGQRWPKRCPACRVQRDRHRHNTWKRQQRGAPAPAPLPVPVVDEPRPTPYTGPELDGLQPDPVMQAAFADVVRALADGAGVLV